ncbi:MAG TPA: hypothetical protein VJ983_07885 [candidate division Zixibacteria bacterium]|nr:hypothetical protein [candidate division Zixibacteria bacterium]
MSEDKSASEGDRIFRNLRSRLEFVEEVCINRAEGITLLCNYLDLLAGYRYGGTSSFSRFRRFLVDDTSQSDIWRKVSLVLLRQHLEGKGLQLYSGLLKVLDEQRIPASSESDSDYRHDLSIETFERKCLTQLSTEDIKLFRKEIERFQYSRILWESYRGATASGISAQMVPENSVSGGSEPFYCTEDTGDGQDSMFEGTYLLFPPAFLVATMKFGLERVRQLAERGDIVLSSAQQFDGLSNTVDSTDPSAGTNAIGYPRLITKPSRSFLKDIGYLIEQAQNSHMMFSADKKEDDRLREGAMSRSAVIASVFFLESLVSSVVEDFGRREPYQLPDIILRNTGLTHNPFGRLPLIERVYLTPYLCCLNEDRVRTGFFDRGSTDFQSLREIAKIRDGYAHSHPIQRRLLITITGDQQAIADDQFPENFWPLTNSPKDIFIVGQDDATRAKKTVEWAVLRLDEFLDGALSRRNWMNSELIEFDPERKHIVACDRTFGPPTDESSEII